MGEIEDADNYYMRLALREARKAVGRTSPNPLVGAVIVSKGIIIGKGFHRKAGTPHAELHALKEAGHAASGATLYVTLEPCNHFGRTPPCTEAILKSNLKRVVIGMADPNPSVCGNGARYLAEKGVQVTSGVLEEACRSINRPFVKHTVSGLPWVILKAAVTIDGKIATASGKSCWITGEKARGAVHRLRDRVDAIMIGVDTALSDDPSLTTRLTGRKGQDPLRVVLDSRLRLPPDAKMLKQESEAETVIFCSTEASSERKRNLEKAGAIVKQIGSESCGHLPIIKVLEELGRAQVTSVLVEGGGRVQSAILSANLADEAYFFMAPILLGNDGIPLVDAFGFDSIKDCIRLSRVRYRRYSDDILLHGFFTKNST